MLRGGCCLLACSVCFVLIPPCVVCCSDCGVDEFCGADHLCNSCPGCSGTPFAVLPDFPQYAACGACYTDLELLVLLPWAEPNFKGLPSRSVAFLPSLSVIFEDLPQMCIQIVYLLASEDTDPGDPAS